MIDAMRAACVLAVAACGARTDLGSRVEVSSPPAPDFLWYKLDETSGTTAHDSSSGHHDIDVAGISWNGGGVFHHACGVLDVGAGYRVAPITITAWLSPALRSDEASNDHALTPFPPDAMSGDVPALGGFGLGLDAWTGGGSALAVETGIDASVAFHSQSGVFVAGTRYFVALVIDASSAKTYVDGQLSATVTADTPPPTSPTPLHLGCHNDDTGYGTKRFFEGTMRDVRVYKRLVAADEIAALYANGPE